MEAGWQQPEAATTNQFIICHNNKANEQWEGQGTSRHIQAIIFFNLFCFFG